jgi:cytochrome P450
VCPYVLHHSPDFFGADAATFNPDRAPFTLPGSTTFAPSIAGIAFGAASHRCPGRFLAETNLAVVVMLVLYHLDCKVVQESGTGHDIPAAPSAVGSDSEAIGEAAARHKGGGSSGQTRAA